MSGFRTLPDEETRELIAESKRIHDAVSASPAAFVIPPSAYPAIASALATLLANKLFGGADVGKFVTDVLGTLSKVQAEINILSLKLDFLIDKLNQLISLVDAVRRDAILEPSRRLQARAVTLGQLLTAAEVARMDGTLSTLQPQLSQTYVELMNARNDVCMREPTAMLPIAHAYAIERAAILYLPTLMPTFESTLEAYKSYAERVADAGQPDSIATQCANLRPLLAQLEADTPDYNDTPLMSFSANGKVMGRVPFYVTWHWEWAGLFTGSRLRNETYRGIKGACGVDQPAGANDDSDLLQMYNDSQRAIDHRASLLSQQSQLWWQTAPQLSDGLVAVKLATTVQKLASDELANFQAGERPSFP